jgi:hypothetical protein
MEFHGLRHSDNPQNRRNPRPPTFHPQGQNELWMALALSHPGVMTLSGPQLAAYIGALVCCDVIRRPMSVWTPYMVR